MSSGWGLGEGSPWLWLSSLQVLVALKLGLPLTQQLHPLNPSPAAKMAPWSAGWPSARGRLAQQPTKCHCVLAQTPTGPSPCVSPLGAEALGGPGRAASRPLASPCWLRKLGLSTMGRGLLVRAVMQAPDSRAQLQGSRQQTRAGLGEGAFQRQETRFTPASGGIS